MNISTQTATALLAGGLLLCCGGLLYRWPAMDRQDRLLFQRIYSGLFRFRPFFRLLWPLGRTPVALVVLLGVVVLSKSMAFSVIAAYLVIAVTERLIKQTLCRPRPFDQLEEVVVAQPLRPLDPSHPSGDTLRIWFLVGVLSQAYPFPGTLVALMVLIAGLVSLGRVALGVHFPLDVLGGLGLGLVGVSLVAFWH